jgi:hypothetical protein
MNSSFTKQITVDVAAKSTTMLGTLLFCFCLCCFSCFLFFSYHAVLLLVASWLILSALDAHVLLSFCSRQGL